MFFCYEKDISKTKERRLIRILKTVLRLIQGYGEMMIFIAIAGVNFVVFLIMYYHEKVP